MSGRRMIHEVLFNNEDLSALPIEARYLYIAMVVHSDDEGRMRADPKFLKLKAFPFDEIRVEKVKVWRDQLATAGCLTVYQVADKEYLQHPKWERWQILRKDRLKGSTIPPISPPCQPTDNQTATNGQPNDRIRKLREVSEVKLTQVNLTELNKDVKADAAPTLGATGADPQEPERMSLEEMRRIRLEKMGAK